MFQGTDRITIRSDISFVPIQKAISCDELERGPSISIDALSEIYNNKIMTTVQAHPECEKIVLQKKSARQKIHEGEVKKKSFHAISGHSLSRFLEDEPDIY